MKDQILEAIQDSEPVDALNALFSVSFMVAKASGISEFNISSLFSSTIEVLFQVHDDEEEEEEEEEEETEEEATV